jgi:copper transport protein
MLDWVHLATGSIWIGGLLGLLLLWRSLPAARRVAGLVVVVPRFSSVALVSVVLLLASGIGASVVHLPTLGSLWQTSYGVAILVKAGILVAASGLAAGNLLRTRPGLARVEAAEGAARLLRRLVAGETLMVAAAIAVAAVLSSLPPPPPSLAKAGSATTSVGPGRAATVVEKDGYRFALTFAPNQAAVPNTFAVQVTKGGRPVRHAQILLAFDMLDMEMPTQTYTLREVAPGTYERAAPALVMVGRWALSFSLTPPGGAPVDLLVVDRASG